MIGDRDADARGMGPARGMPDGLADPEDPGQPEPTAAGVRSLDGVREQIGVWRSLLDRPLTSYYLVLGITIPLLGLGLVMVQSTASVTDLSAGLSPYSDFKKQLLGAAIGSRCSPATRPDQARRRTARLRTYPSLGL